MGTPPSGGFTCRVRDERLSLGPEPHDARSHQTNSAAAAALAGISPEGVRALSGALTNQSVTAAKASAEVCRVILTALANHAFRLCQSTDGPPDRSVRLKVDADIAAPALFQRLESLDGDLRTTAAVALIGFGAGSGCSTEVLRVLREDKSRACWQIYTGLRLHMEEANSADGSFELFWLLPFLQYYDVGLRDAVTNTLIAIDPRAAASAGVDTNIVGWPH